MSLGTWGGRVSCGLLGPLGPWELGLGLWTENSFSLVLLHIGTAVDSFQERQRFVRQYPKVVFFTAASVSTFNSSDRFYIVVYIRLFLPSPVCLFPQCYATFAGPVVPFVMIGSSCGKKQSFD
jgi:hypothetical protein